jgi:hypothetical protein
MRTYASVTSYRRHRLVSVAYATATSDPESVRLGSAVDRAGKVFARSDDGDGVRLLREVERLPSSVDNMNPKHHFVRTLQSISIDAAVHAHSIIPLRGDALPTRLSRIR